LAIQVARPDSILAIRDEVKALLDELSWAKWWVVDITRPRIKFIEVIALMSVFDPSFQLKLLMIDFDIVAEAWNSIIPTALRGLKCSQKRG
jgi:hypothetical protein